MVASMWGQARINLINALGLNDEDPVAAPAQPQAGIEDAHPDRRALITAYPYLESGINLLLCPSSIAYIEP